MANSIGIICLAIFLLLYALFALTNVTVSFGHVVMGILAAVSGFCLLFGIGKFWNKP